MTILNTQEIFVLLDTPIIRADAVRAFFLKKGVTESDITITQIKENESETMFVKLIIPGKNGQSQGGSLPSLGIIGRLGGIGARPHKVGLVSDADGALVALAAAAKLASMKKAGDTLGADVLVATHLCPASPIVPHDPVPFMGAPVSMETMNSMEVDERMQAILTVDATKGNRIFNQRGFAITPTVKAGYILRVSEDLLDIMQSVTGEMPKVFPITHQDITPYGNDIYHVNSILQPATATSAPVIGIAITSGVPVPGCASGANQPLDIESAVRFVVEVAKNWGEGKCSFYDEVEFKNLIKRYGSMEHLQTLGKST